MRNIDKLQMMKHGKILFHLLLNGSCVMEWMETIRSSNPEADPRLLKLKQKFRYLAHKYRKLKKNQLMPLLRNRVQNPQTKPQMSVL